MRNVLPLLGLVLCASALSRQRRWAEKQHNRPVRRVLRVAGRRPRGLRGMTARKARQTC
jgi:hypothetical protein